MSPLLFLFIGVFYLCLSALLMAVNGIVLLILLRKKSFSNGTFLVIKHICLTCIIQLLCFFVSGVMTVFRYNFGFYFEKMLGAVLLAGWFLYILLSLTLAVDRLAIFLFMKRTNAFGFVRKLLLTCSWLVFTACVVVLNLPTLSITYSQDSNYLTWVYSAEARSELLIVEESIDFAVLSAILICYVAIFVLIFTKRQRNANEEEDNHRAEKRILFVSVFSFLFDGFSVFCGCFVLPLVSLEEVTLVIVSFLWITGAGVFSIIIIVLNSSIRKSLQSFLFKSKVSVIYVTTT